MKKNEIIELNGKEYTLELNRDSFVKIDKLCNIEKTMEIVNKKPYEYIDEIDDNFNPMEDITGLSLEELQKIADERDRVLTNLVERSIFLWLYPNYQLKISEVHELLKPYFEDNQKLEWLGEQVSKYLFECVKIRETYIEEQKNLQALANKKK